MVEHKPIDEVELKNLISKILCKQFGFCPVEPETDKTPNKSIPVLKIGENYIQWSSEKGAYRVWNNNGEEIGIAKPKDDACKECKPWSDGEFYGVR